MVPHPLPASLPAWAVVHVEESAPPPLLPASSPARVVTDVEARALVTPFPDSDEVHALEGRSRGTCHVFMLLHASWLPA